MLHRAATYAYYHLILVLPTILTLHPIPSPPDEIDVIERIDIDPTQIIITTTKQGSYLNISSQASYIFTNMYLLTGPIDNLQIHIEVANLSEDRQLPPINVYGMWLLTFRGRYTIPFLKPDRWYGLSFQSENFVNDRVVRHRDDRIVKTPSRQGNNTDIRELYNVKMHRNLDEQENLEGLYVTAKWLSHQRINNSELLVKTKVYCNNSVATEDIVLHHDEDAITVEITIDHKYDFESLNATSNYVRAHITPLKCHKVCWHSSIAVPNNLYQFTSDLGEECRDIEGTTGTTYLRKFRRFMVEGNNVSEYEVVVETELAEEREEAFVTLSALRLGDNDTDFTYKTYSSLNSDGRFSLPLDDDGVYAVQYEYTKVKPFHYSTKKYFVVESPAANSSYSNHPLVNIIIEPKAFKPASSVKIREHPTVTLIRGEEYRNHEIMLHVEPFWQNVFELIETKILTRPSERSSADASDG
uniref:CA domain-containing protein n=1 Tax=Heterorhabditis bacteriophora TaxID=37862 RepID=A0A1I7XE46_HETBA